MEHKIQKYAIQSSNMHYTYGRNIGWCSLPNQMPHQILSKNLSEISQPVIHDFQNIHHKSAFINAYRLHNKPSTWQLPETRMPILIHVLKYGIFVRLVKVRISCILCL